MSGSISSSLRKPSRNSDRSAAITIRTGLAMAAAGGLISAAGERMYRPKRQLNEPDGKPRRRDEGATVRGEPGKRRDGKPKTGSGRKMSAHARRQQDYCLKLDKSS